jgi:hypothetical protein
MEIPSMIALAKIRASVFDTSSFNTTSPVIDAKNSLIHSHPERRWKKNGIEYRMPCIDTKIQQVGVEGLQHCTTKPRPLSEVEMERLSMGLLLDNDLPGMFRFLPHRKRIERFLPTKNPNAHQNTIIAKQYRNT